jgi:hypothetical protein
MNDLVHDVSSKIQAVCNETPQCVFIDVAASINNLAGHYYEPGVDETYDWPRFYGNGIDMFVASKLHTLLSSLTSSREETWFYEWQVISFTFWQCRDRSTGV